MGGHAGRFGPRRPRQLTDEECGAFTTLLAALYAYETDGRSDQLDSSLRAAWLAFDRERMEKLLGCL